MTTTKQFVVAHPPEVTNVGTGTGANVFKGKLGKNLEFRRIVPGNANITITETNDLVYISSSLVPDGGSALGLPINIADVTGLQTSLDSKSVSTHNHNLDSLSDVLTSSKASGNVLQWDGAKWVNRTLSAAGIQAAGVYPTITLSGAITGSGTTSITTSLADSGVVAGTFPKVTVNSKGIVTSGSALIASDIPNLSWSKITSGVPNTWTPPIASSTVLGGVKIGANLTIGVDGTLSANTTIPVPDIPIATYAVPGIVRIGNGLNIDNAGVISIANSGTYLFSTQVITGLSVGQSVIACSYIVGLIKVFLNGVRLLPGIDYIATDGVTLLLTSPVSSTDYEIVVDKYQPNTSVANIDYTLPAATSSSLGGVKVGNSLSINNLGVLDTNKSLLGLSNIDNTSDLNKPVSYLQQSALDNKSDIGHTHSDYVSKTASSNVMTGTISHTGLVPTEGINIDQILTITKTITITEDWQDTGIKANNLASGTYVVQLYANDSSAGGSNNNETYSGIMSWYSGDTGSSLDLPTDEIQLHRAGGSSEGGLYLRTFKTPHSDPDNLKLQIYANQASTSAANYVFRFRRLI